MLMPIEKIEALSMFLPSISNGGGAYYFYDSPGQRADWYILAGLSALSEAMSQDGATEPLKSLPDDLSALARLSIADIFACDPAETCLEVQFNDPDMVPLRRGEVVNSFTNSRDGRLSLDAQHTPPAKDLKWAYQWRVINELLPAVTDPAVWGWVTAHGAPLYKRLVDSVAPVKAHALPVPFEWLGVFSDPARRVVMPESKSVDTLLRAEIERIHLSEETGNDAYRHHAALQRGYLLNLPSAQGCIAALKSEFGLDLPVLTGDKLAQGAAAAALDVAGLMTETPLYYYIRREAQVFHNGHRYGPLGSHILAQTFVGLVQCDPESYWSRVREDGRPWEPDESEGQGPRSQHMTQRRRG